MSVITNNTIQPSSGQALTIKDEGGTASITVATNGEATFAENIIIGTAGKGITFQDTDSSNDGITADEAYTIDSYETGTWTPTVTGVTGTIATQSNQRGTYQKIGNFVTLEFSFKIPDAGTSTGRYKITNLPFNVQNYDASLSTRTVAGVGYESATTGYMLQVFANSTTELQVRKYDHGGITNAFSSFNCFIKYQTS